MSYDACHRHARSPAQASSAPVWAASPLDREDFGDRLRPVCSAGRRHGSLMAAVDARHSLSQRQLVLKVASALQRRRSAFCASLLALTRGAHRHGCSLLLGLDFSISSHGCCLPMPSSDYRIP